jgi:signal transduction histidine kinase
MPEPVASAFSILVVDDQAESRDLLKLLLGRIPGANFQIETSADGDDALRRLQGKGFDLVFLDYRLPPTDGLDVLDKIRQHHPKTAVVMTTTSGSEQIAVAAMKKGAMDYLTHKDLQQADMGQLLRRVVEIRNLVNQNMELRQVNQMKNEFIANVSHELRTPLTVVIGYANTLRDGGLGAVNEPQKKALTSVIERAEGLLATLNNILRIREVHEGRKPMLLKPADLRAIASAQLERAGKEGKRKKLTLHVKLGETPVWVLADADRIADVVDNMLSNATKFSPSGGALDVELAADAGRARLSVVDRGPGVAPELMPHVFERFFAANQGPTREYPGLGLGLPLSKEIVEQHGGRIWLESRGAGTGTTARLELPLCAPDAAPSVIDGAGTVRKKSVLIVEDNPDLVEVLMLFLSSVSRNLSIATARSGFEALEKIKDEAPSLVILDVMMPGMDGFEVLSRLRRLAEGERVPVMVLTGYSDLVERAREAGAKEVLLKPFEKNVFVRKVLQLLQESPK